MLGAHELKYNFVLLQVEKGTQLRAFFCFQKKKSNLLKFIAFTNFWCNNANDLYNTML